jgi:hypothetical protein
MGVFVYALCALTSLVCFALLLRQHLRAPSHLAFRSSVAFLCFAVANLILFIDLVLVPDTDLRIYRNLINLTGAVVLLLALTGDNERSSR